MSPESPARHASPPPTPTPTPPPTSTSTLTPAAAAAAAAADTTTTTTTSPNPPGIYSSRPTLDIPAANDDPRPAPVKYMCAAHAQPIVCMNRAEVLTAGQVHARIPEPFATPRPSRLEHTPSQGTARADAAREAADRPRKPSMPAPSTATARMTAAPSTASTST